MGNASGRVQYMNCGGSIVGGARPEARRPAGLSMTAATGKASIPALMSAQYMCRLPCTILECVYNTSSTWLMPLAMGYLEIDPKTSVESTCAVN